MDKELRNNMNACEKNLLMLAAAGMVCLLSSCASSDTLSKQQTDLPKDKINAAGLFGENCVGCHGTNGRAHTFHGIILGAQNLTDAKWQIDTTDDEIVHAIQTGPHAMPEFDKKLSESEIEALAMYVRTLKAAN
jgi:mono/diheme cytochrome c family protein